MDELSAEALERDLALDPLARALVPALVHRLNNTTQLLTSLQALLAIPEAEELLARRAGDLADAAREVDDAGWCLAVVASACGTELLLARRRADGLDALVGELRHALRREGRELPAPARPLPRLCAEPPVERATEGAWRLPWAVGLALWCTASAELAWSVERTGDGDVLRLDRAPAEPLATHAARLAAGLPGARLARAGDGWRLALPAGWLAPSAEAAP